MRSGRAAEVKRVILTASGGPFRGFGREKLSRVTVDEALKHPNWSMGVKVTVDSATLMNKGFEVIEAHWLFGLEYEKIEVAIHPESIVHSLVHFIDGSHVAQLGLPSMLLPIQYALSYPERLENSFPHLQWGESLTLTFQPPDRENFPCLELAYEAGRRGGTMPAVLNGANEYAVESFLKGELKFLHIPALLEGVMKSHTVVRAPGFSDFEAADSWAREEAERILSMIKR
jgi:1-deoxy-D-xylulose-5-phosphate reductoisomerase